MTMPLHQARIITGPDPLEAGLEEQLELTADDELTRRSCRVLTPVLHRVGRTEEFVIEIEPREGEAKVDNNYLRCQVQVRNEKTRVLLVQSYPSYEFHYLKTLLSREQTETGGARRQPVELHVLLQDADPEFADIDGTAIANREFT